MTVLENTTKKRALKLYHRNYDGTDSTLTSYLIWQTTRSGEAVPGYKKKIAELQSATSDYSRKDTAVDLGYFRAFIAWKMNKTEVFEELYDEYGINRMPSQTPVDTSRAYNTALGNFLQNANEVVSPFKGMAFLSELKGTLEMLRNPASALRNGFSAYLKRARRIRDRVGRPPAGGSRRLSAWRRKAKRANKVLANSWLEYCYGWRPLMADVESACNAYSAFQSKVDTLRVYGNGEDRTTGSTSSTTQNHPNYFKYTLTTVSYSRAKCVFKGVVRNDFRGVDTSTASEIIRLSGFRLEEFIPTIWELIPYSFVVDYFTNVGTILNGMHALAMDFAWLSCSVKTENICESNQRLDEAWIRQVLNTAVTGVSQSSRPSKIVTTFYTRSAPALSLPSLQLELPSSNWSWANLAALLASKWR